MTWLFMLFGVLMKKRVEAEKARFTLMQLEFAIGDLEEEAAAAAIPASASAAASDGTRPSTSSREST